MSARRTGTPAGAAVARLTAAGNAVWCDGGPDFIFNRLEVSGPDESLYDFIGAASGPGFVDWRPEWHSVYEQIYFSAVRGGAPTREAAEHLARKLRDILWRRHEEERVRAELDSHRVPLDLHALIPIPSRVLRKGFGETGREWMWRNWGVRWPIRRVTFHLRQGLGGQVAIDHERRDKIDGKRVAVFRFISEDWPPWIAVLRMRERWPDLRFEMRAEYLQ
jgi:hypothetical protein